MEKIIILAEPWVVRSLFLCGALSLLFGRKGRGPRAAGGAPAWSAVILITLLGAWLRFGVLPHRHIAAFDEYSHAAISRTLETTGRLCDLKKGSLESPEICGLSPWVGAYHTALAEVYRVTGTHGEKAAFLFSAALGTLSIPAVYLAAAGSGGSAAGIFAALFLALSRQHLLFSAASETGILSSLLMLAALMALRRYFREENLPSALLLVSACGAALFTRFENSVLLAFVPWALYHRKSALRPFLVLAPYAALITAVFAAHLYLSAHNTHLGVINLPLAARLPSTFLKNILFWADPAYNQPALVPLFLYGAWAVVREKTYLCALPLLYLLVYGAFAEPFSAGPDTSRFALNLLPLYLLAAGTGAERLLALARGSGLRRGAGAAFAAVFAAHSLYALKDAGGLYGRGAAAARECRSFLAGAADKVPAGRYILTYAPSYVACGTQLKVMLPDYLDTPASPVLLFQDMTWDIIARQYPGKEKDLRSRYKFRLLHSNDGSRPPGGQRCALYMLEPKTVPSPVF